MSTPLQQCTDVCAASSCAEENAKCLVSQCGSICKATWVSNGTDPKVLCPSGLPAGAISDAIANLKAREALLIRAREAYRLGSAAEGSTLLAQVIKLSSGGEEVKDGFFGALCLLLTFCLLSSFDLLLRRPQRPRWRRRNLLQFVLSACKVRVLHCT